LSRSSRGAPAAIVDGRVLVEPAGPPGVLRTTSFAKGQTDEGLDLLRSIVVEGVLVVIRHPARGEFPAVVELQIRATWRVPLLIFGQRRPCSLSSY